MAIKMEKDEVYGGHWIYTDQCTYYFSEGTTFSQIYDMLMGD